MGAFEDLKLPYQEFMVADFLREHMRFTPQNLHEYELACLTLMRAASVFPSRKMGACSQATWLCVHQTYRV